MKNRKNFFFITLWSALILISSPALAKLQIGEVLSATGAKVQVNGQIVKASVPLFWGDRLITGPDSTLEILLFPSFSLKLKPSAEVKLIGNLVQTQGQKILTSTAVQALKGKIQGRVLKTADLKYDIKVFARRTISSIRGTTFEIDAAEDMPSEAGDSSESVQVFEGEIEVADISAKSEKNLSVSGGMKMTTEDEKVQTATAEAPRDLQNSEVVFGKWDQNKEAVLSSHQKEAKKYKLLLDQDIKSVSSSMKKDAKKMFQSIKGTYDQFKKKK